MSSILDELGFGPPFEPQDPEDVKAGIEKAQELEDRNPFLEGVARRLTELCRAQADMPPYVEKQAELLYILLDTYQELGDAEKCRELVTELDRLNEKYADQGVSCKVPRRCERPWECEDRPDNPTSQNKKPAELQAVFISTHILRSY